MGLGATATALAAGWTSPKAVQPGVNPVLTFSPTGTAALGSELLLHGRRTGTEIDLAADGRDLAAHPRRIPAPSAGHGPEPLTGLALSSDGYLAAGFTDPYALTPVLTQVAAPVPSPFAKVQQLIPLGVAATRQAIPDTVTLVATADGEIVGAGTDDAGDLYTTSLAPRQTDFHTAPGPRGLTSTDDFRLATDPGGDTFLAGDGTNGCTTVAVRPPRGRFTTTYRTGNCRSGTPNVADAITATTGGAAALLSEDVSVSGTAVTRLLVQTGHAGRFGAATQLGGALGGPVGLASDADGELTAEWTGCTAGAVVAARLTLTHCEIDAATGSAQTGFTATAAAGTPLLDGEPGATLTAFTVDRGVVVSRCRAGRCGLYGFTAAPGGGFRPAHLLGGARRVITATGDDHGDLLAVWVDASGRLDAATADAATGTWSAARQLSAGAVDPATVTAAYGPRGTAMVAWSSATETYAAAYSTSGR